jgi:hypothetical protein
VTGIDTSTAQPARRYNYWLGGSAHFEADRVSGDAIEAAMPTIRLMATENRKFLGRAARFVAAQGIRQFLDIGSGIPAPGNSHEVVQAVEPGARVVYVDNDPLVHTYAGSLPPTVTMLNGDLRDPAAILRGQDLDLTRPVGLLLVAVLHFVRDDEDPAGVVSTLLDALPAGSYVVASHATWEYVPAEAIGRLQAMNPDGRFTPRDGTTFGSLFGDRLDLVAPGLTSVAHWRADGHPPAVEDVSCNGLVGRRR